MERDGPKAQDPFAGLLEALAGEIGEESLASLVALLRDHMSARIAMITRGEGSPVSRARAIVATEDGQAVEIAYELEGTPCKQVYEEGRTLVVPCWLARAYPKEKGFEGYIGVPLLTPEGTVFGHLAVLSDAAIEGVDRAEQIMRILAQRVAAELLRQDLTEERERLVDRLKHQNRRFRQLHATARAQTRQKTKVLGMIAHDLRGPLTAILAQAELGLGLAERPSPGRDKLSRAYSKIIGSAERLATLIDGTLDRARAEDEFLLADRGPVDLRALFDAAQEAVLSEAEAKEIQVRIGEVPTDLGLCADEGLLLRAIDNLMSNAVKYGLAGGRVSLTARQEGACLAIAVSDDGQGLTDHDLTRVFGRFETLSARPTGGEVSTGLGLSNVRDIVEAHGGQVRAESPGQGQGATFTLLLPLEQEELATPA